MKTAPVMKELTERKTFFKFEFYFADQVTDHFCNISIGYKQEQVL